MSVPELAANGATLSLAERDRRWAALDAAVREAGLDALVVAGNDHRGHKGALRWVSDYRLYYRFGYALVAPGEAPMLVLPANLRDDVASPWIETRAHAAEPAAELAARIGALARRERIGIVGLANGAMRASEYLRLQALLPATRFSDAGPLFDKLRAAKSAEELAALEGASAIADACFERLLEVARPGRSERDVEASMLEACARFGGDDPLFLCMGVQDEGSGGRPFMGAPRHRPLATGEAFAFSFEMTGPGGYWVEMCRMLAFGSPAEPVVATAAAAAASAEAARLALVPGAAPDAVYRAAAEAIDPARYDVGRALGHSIGQDVVETPLFARDALGEAPLQTGMAFAVHPRFVGRHELLHGYCADTLVLDGPVARRLSRWPQELFVLPGGGRR